MSKRRLTALCGLLLCGLLLVMLVFVSGCAKRTYPYSFKYQTTSSVIGSIQGADKVTVGICPFDVSILHGEGIDAKVAQFNLKEDELSLAIAEGMAHQLKLSDFKPVIIKDPATAPELKDGSVNALVMGKLTTLTFEGADSMLGLTTTGMIVGSSNLKNIKSSAVLFENEIKTKYSNFTIFNGAAVFKSSLGHGLNMLISKFIDDICGNNDFKLQLQKLCLTNTK